MSKKIIIVDDSKTVLATAEMALEGLVNDGTIVLKTYVNPAELHDALIGGTEDYDLLISDINMPQLNGLDLAAELKQIANFKSKPILILTTESSAEMKTKGKEIGVTGWLVKPFSDEKLVKAIKMVLGI
ncbi:response regulator [Candidatus Sulfurimonas marisnigri]|uniref:Response regulator n=2 Tax=Candidatus Sulfurimonas marisnigri TaxID=2740405 RepID=A0A7S7M2D3_9BACT|nr:response regulator [Candidatus Sulfurimonas marisnigri]QOY55862.1 response regulator [Candidatus Sulfurimonas marisnigri]